MQSFRQFLIEGFQVPSQTWIVQVSVYDPNHSMVTRRDEPIAKKIRVAASTRDEAKTKAVKFYRAGGYTGVDVWSVEPTGDDLDEAEFSRPWSVAQDIVRFIHMLGFTPNRSSQSPSVTTINAWSVKDPKIAPGRPLPDCYDKVINYLRLSNYRVIDQSLGDTERRVAISRTDLKTPGEFHVTLEKKRAWMKGTDKQQVQVGHDPKTGHTFVTFRPKTNRGQNLTTESKK